MSLPLKRLATVIAGQSPVSDEVEDLADALPFIQGNAEFGLRHPSPKWQCATAPKVACTDDVLISVRAPVGATNIAEGPLGIGRGVAAVRATDMNPAYLYWFLTSSSDLLHAEATGSTFAAITASDLGDLKVPIADVADQRAIADYLDRETATIDALIEKQRRLVDGLHERSEALVRSGVFGKEQGAARADRWIPNLPAGWSIEPLRRHTALVNGSTPNRANPDYWQGGQHAWLNSSHANSDVVVAADQWVTDAAVEECHLPRLCRGTVLVAITGQGKTRGKATLLTIRATINQHLAGILPEARQWDARFLTLILRAAYDELRLISDAGGSTRGALTLSSLGNVLVARPSLAEQRQIADHLDRETAKIDALIARAERFIELAQERRAALITAAVTGQIEIPTED